MLKVLERNERIFLLSILIFAFAVRLGFTLLTKQYYFFADHPSSDVTYYQDWAYGIATQNFIGDKTFFGLPLYPYFLALLFRISLGHIEIIRLFHLLLGSLNCLLIYLIAKKIFNRRTAGLTAMLMASNFLMIYYDWLMMPVTFIITLTLIITLALMDKENLTRPHHWIILGLIIGLAILGDGKFLFFLGAAALWLWWKCPKKINLVLLMCLGSAAVLGACGLRNKIIGGDWILISAQSGLSLYAGNNPDATGTYLSPDFIRPTHAAQDEDQRIVAEAILKKSLTPGQISAFWKKKAVNFIVNQPGQYLNLLGKKFLLFFRETEHAYDLDLLFLRSWKNRWDYNPVMILFPLAMIGITISFSQWKKNPFPVMLIGCQLLITLIFFLSARQRATIFPFLLMFEAATIFWIFQTIQQKKAATLLAPGVLIIFFLFFSKPIALDEQVINANFYAKAGPVHIKNGDLEQAKISLFKALELQPNDTTTIYNLGNIAVMQGDLDAAQQFYLSALKTCAFNIDALFNLGYVYEQKNDFDKALEAYNNVLTYQPDMPDVYFRIAGIYAKKKDCPTAVSFYKKVIMLHPELEVIVHEQILNCQQ